MIRAKTLLASIVFAGTAVTIFIVNSDLDGFVPTDISTRYKVDSEAETPFASDVGITPSNAISQLPKLAQNTSAQRVTPRIVTPVLSGPPVHQIVDASQSPVSVVKAERRVSTPGESIQPENRRKTSAVVSSFADQTFVQRKKIGERADVTENSVPLPSRLPLENQLLRAKRLARLNGDRNLEGEDALFDPAIPAIANAQTLRLKNRRRANRLRAARNRSAARQRQANQQKASTIKKPAPQKARLRHREPFDESR